MYECDIFEAYLISCMHCVDDDNSKCGNEKQEFHLAIAPCAMNDLVPIGTYKLRRHPVKHV